MAATEVVERRMNEVEKQLKPFFRRVEDSIAVPKLTGDTVAQHMNLLTLTPPETKQFVEDVSGVHLLVCVRAVLTKWFCVTRVL